MKLWRVISTESGLTVGCRYYESLRAADEAADELAILGVEAIDVEQVNIPPMTILFLRRPDVLADLLNTILLRVGLR
jgi:hypothetical protein